VTELPSGTVTFLFTDVEGSTRLWEEHPDAMRAALARHDELVAAAIAASGGHVVKTTGDGFHAVFATAHDAIDAAVAAQLGIEQEPWSEPVRVRVRMGVHTGEAHQRDGDYYGSSTNRAARFMSAGHGGQIVVSGVTAALVAEHLPADFELLSLGEHRLRDLAEPVAVFQLAAPGLQREFPTLRSLDAYPSNLPAQLSSFVGRERDVFEIATLLRDKRLVTLTGVGGVGKTRLALQVAGDVLPRFRDGAWLCELAPVRDPSGVVDAVASVFHVTARPGLSLEESLVAYLRDQELLVVLDNCEHLLRGAARVVAAIQGACAGVRVLATSREGLSIPGEQILVVPSLGLPDDADGAGSESGECEAVRLFAERAVGAHAAFTVDDTNRAEVVAICTRLDGVALAIELAAARIPTMNPAELAQRLDRRFRLLSGGNRVAIERHQTLRATIDWSYDLLSESEQRLLDRMSVFVGGCTLEAVEAVCAGEPIDVDEVYELLARLVAHHLVVADTGTGTETRYRLLETIRQYGEERLSDTGDTDRIRARHGDHYADFAGAVQAHVLGSEQIEWGTRLAREHDNLHAAMAYALDTQDVERAMRLVCQVPFRGMQINDVVVFDPEPILALTGAVDHPGSAVALLDAAWDAQRRGDGPRALELCDAALAAEQRLGPTPDSYLAMWSWNLRAFLANADGAPGEEAASCWLEAAREAGAADNPGSQAIYLCGAARSLADTDPVAARDYATEGLALARRSRKPTAIANALLMTALVFATDDPDRARALLDEAVQLPATLGYEYLTSLTLTAALAAQLAAWPIALRAASRALGNQLRSGLLWPAGLAGMFRVAARGLAELRPEPAAVLQGARDTVLRRIVPTGTTHQYVAPEWTRTQDRDTTQLLVAALGDARLEELRAEGASMDDDQICIYARRQIDAYLATINEDA
jgi:predicted ATPase/class 3 adenylate cyclase